MDYENLSKDLEEVIKKYIDDDHDREAVCSAITYEMSYEVAIPNFFHREHVERFLDKSLTDEEYANFLTFTRKYVTEGMSEWFSDFLEMERDFVLERIK